MCSLWHNSHSVAWAADVLSRAGAFEVSVMKVSIMGARKFGNVSVEGMRPYVESESGIEGGRFVRRASVSESVRGKAYVVEREGLSWMEA